MSRGLKDADDGNADMTNRNRIQGRLAKGNQAMDWVARTHSDRRAGKSGVARVKDTTVVDIDLEKFFDRVNHDVLVSLSGKGGWRRSHSPPMQEGLSLDGFKKQGLICLLHQYVMLQR